MKRCVAALLLVFAARAVLSHVTGTGLATLQAEERTLRYRVTLAATDLAPEFAQRITLAADGDQIRAQEVAQWVRDHVSASTREGACRPGRVRMQRSSGGDDRLALEVELTCPADIGAVQFSDTLPKVFGEHWNTVISALSPDGSREERVLSSTSGPVEFDFGRRAPATPRTLLEFIRLGVEHIATGLDHLLFLLALILGVSRVMQTLAVVSVFTLAHAATFTLASLQLVSIPPALVEPAIALSIAWMAWDSTRFGGSARTRYGLTFAFGLVHGLGFATALQPLALQDVAMMRALLGFAVGVEIGQVVFVIAALALLGALGRVGPTAPWKRRAGFTLIAVGVVWFAARVAGLAS